MLFTILYSLGALAAIAGLSAVNKDRDWVTRWLGYAFYGFFVFLFVWGAIHL